MMTERQNAVMNWIAFNEMTPENGARPRNADDANCWLWVDEIAADCDMTIPEAKGVVGSLASQGLIQVDDIGSVVHTEFGRREDIGVCFTEAGFAAWSAQNPE